MTAITLPQPRDPGSAPPAEDFARLAKRVRDAGLMGKRPGYYSVKITATSVALVVLGTIGVLLASSWWTIVVALGVAFTLGQLSFIAHDAGHRQVSRNRRHNHVIGMVLTNLCAGFSFTWWLDKHNRHHAHTNQPGKDPDLEPGALAYTRDQVEARQGLPRWFARIQAVTLVPLLFLEAVNLHVASVIHLIRRRDRGAVVEAALLIGHAALFFVAPFLVMGIWQAVVFVLVTQTAFGFYLGASFVTNHVGMPVLSSTGHHDYLRRQVLTSRNLRRRGRDRIRGRRPGRPDRAPPLPLHAPRQSAPGPGAGPVVLRRRVDQLHRGQCLAGLPGRLRPPLDHRRPAPPSDHGVRVRGQPGEWSTP